MAGQEGKMFDSQGARTFKERLLLGHVHYALKIMSIMQYHILQRKCLFVDSNSVKILVDKVNRYLRNGFVSFTSAAKPGVQNILTCVFFI